MPRVAAFNLRSGEPSRTVVGADRRVKVVPRPYSLESSGWVER